MTEIKVGDKFKSRVLGEAEYTELEIVYIHDGPEEVLRPYVVRGTLRGMGKSALGSRSAETLIRSYKAIEPFFEVGKEYQFTKYGTKYSVKTLHTASDGGVVAIAEYMRDDGGILVTTMNTRDYENIIKG